MGLALLEWSVVVSSLAITFGVGLWFSRQGKKSLQEYMLGNRRMSVLPISLSIAATQLTGSAIVSTAQEVYLYGMHLSLSIWVFSIMGSLLVWIYLPVSYSIQSASSFEYFERRFNRHIRKLASLIYALETIHHTAMAQYVPALSLSQASGLPAFPIAVVLSLICLVYTATGGLKAVAWADSCQAIILAFCAVFVALVGAFLAGGPMQIWQKGEEGSRMEFYSFDISPDVRYSTTNLIILGSLTLSQIHLSPSFHQRIASMPTYGQAVKVVIWSSIFAGAFFAFECFTGLVVYSYFAGCDPVLAKKGIKHHSRILPYFVDRISEKFPGIESLFLSGVIAGGLSTTTSCWNTVACTIYEDFVVPWLGQNISKKTAFRFLMGIVVIFSVVSTAFILLIENMSSLMEATQSMKAITFSMIFVLYNGGMFLPWANSKGIIAGCVASGVITNYIVLGAQHARMNKLVVDLPKILTTAKCAVNGTTMEALNMTTTIGTEGYGLVTVSDPSVPRLFTMSLCLFMIPGIGLGLVVSYLVSLITGGQDLTMVDREMIVPLMRWALPRNSTSIEKALDSTESTKLTLPPQDDENNRL